MQPDEPMKLNFHDHFCPSNDVVFGVMFGKQKLFCKIIQAVTNEKIQLEGDPHTQATLREDDALLNQIRFDVFAQAVDQRFYSADMQRSYKIVRMNRRTVYYACRAISTQSVDDMAYEDLNPVYVVFIFTTHADNRPIQHIKLCDVDTHEVFDDLLDLTLVYVPTVVKTVDKKTELYIFARFFKINTLRQAEKFVKECGKYDLGKELITMYNNTVANVNDLQQIETRPYFIGRLTEEQIAEIRKKAAEKAAAKATKEAEAKAEIKLKAAEAKAEIKLKAAEAKAEKSKRKSAKNLLLQGLAPEIISACIDIDIDIVQSIRTELQPIEG